MKVWITAIGEPIPIDKAPRNRLFRAGYLAKILAEQGHHVVWWTSTFDHFQKAHVFRDDTTVQNEPYLEIRLLHGHGYGSNLSVWRILDHRKLAKKFYRAARRQEPPDIILCSFPTIELSRVAVRFGQERGIPVVLDMRDMWPDIFLEVVPKWARGLAGLLARPMFRDARVACAGATAITGITDAFVDWGLRRGGRSRTVMDRAFPMGYIARAPERERVTEAGNYWDGLGIKDGRANFVVCFFGTFGRQLDLETVISAARSLANKEKKVLFVMCGKGDRTAQYRELASGNPGMIFPGWVDAAQTYVLMRRSRVGLDPLPDRYDFLATINNKAIEYLSAGLPVISSPDRGVLSDLLREHECGMSYPYEDANALTSVLSGLYEDRTRLLRMSENGVRVFNEMFTAEKVYGEMMEYLIQIVDLYKSGKTASSTAWTRN
jgi:glycosyltransferase involved in cell wall biosynthesis